jgi:hypothetical protein
MRLILMGLLVMFSLFACGGKSVEDQARALGSREFSAARWAAGTQEQRGEMVASLLAKHAPSSLTAKDVISLLGSPTSYYLYDEYPAYVVGPKSIQSDYGRGYVLAFVTDKRSSRVIKVLFIPEVRT